MIESKRRGQLYEGVKEYVKKREVELREEKKACSRKIIGIIERKV